MDVAMLRAPDSESPVLAILPMLLSAYLTLPDRDGDSYSDVRELVTGCDLFDAASFPTCQWGEVVACSLAEPGFTPPPEPC